jgi:hypothetical protein
MPSAYVDASDLRFPQRCIRCDGAVEVTHNLRACRGIDLLLVSYFQFLDIPIPVCRHCRRRRRLIGFATYAGAFLFIFAGGFTAVELLSNGWKIASAVLGATILVVALGLRVRGGDALVEWVSLGVAADLLKGDGTRLRLTVRRDQYFASWLSINPGAAISSGPMGGQSPSRRNLL